MKVLILGIKGIGGVSTHIKYLLQEYQKLNYNYYFFNYYSKRGWSPGKKNPLVFYENIKKFLKMTVGYFLFLLFNYKKFEIVHTHVAGSLKGFLPGIITIKFKKIFKYNVVITIHSSNIEEFILKYPDIMQYILKNSENIIVVSEKQKRAITSKFKGYEKKIVPIPNGYDPSSIKKRINTHSNNDRDKYIITNVGWLMEKKGQIYLLEAIKILTNKGIYNIQCYIIGKGPLEEELKNVVTNLKINDFVIITGFINDEKKNQILNKSDLFIIPSLDEGNPIVMFEALGFGLPIIATDVGGIPEIINSEDIGIIVPTRNSSLLAEAIMESIKRKWNRDIIRSFAENYTWEKIARKTIDIYIKTKNS